MSLLLAWLVFPLILGTLALGCGLLLERTARITLPGALLLPVGLAVIIVAAQLATLTDATAELATPLVVVLAVAGLAIARPWRSRRLDQWAVAACAGVFAMFAAPIVLSGAATFADYARISDTATWLAIVDRVMEHGRNLDGLPPSTYQAALQAYLGGGYPVGAFLPLGVARPLVGQDSAWLFQPYMAFLAAMLSLSLYAIAVRLIELPWQRALAAAIAAQPALLFGYSLVGGMKEVASAWIVALAVALIPSVLAESHDRSVLPLALATGAALAIMSFGGTIWFLPVLLAALALLFVARGREVALRKVAWFAAFAVALSLPALPAAIDFVSTGTELVTKENDLGALFGPLSPFQVLGIWPVGDFRLRPGNEAATYFLLVVLIGAIVGGLAWAWFRRAPQLIVYVGAVMLAVIVITIPASPWIDAKTFAIASPAFMLAGAIGALALFGTGMRFEAALVTAALVGGVLWSNVLAYHDVNLAPRDRMAELQDIGDRIAGEGPTLVMDSEFFAAKHFLRDAAPQAASARRPRQVLLRNGQALSGETFADIDSFDLNGLLGFRTLVLPRSPTASRPPSVFRLEWAGRYYEVWHQPASSPPRIADHLSLGSLYQPVGRVRCRDVRRLAGLAGPRGRLATVKRRRAIALQLSGFANPVSWKNDPRDPRVVYPHGSGTATARIDVGQAGRYEAWVGGAFRQPVTFAADGRTLKKVGYTIMLTGDYMPLGEVQWHAGVHRIDLSYGGRVLHPGSGSEGDPFPLGPVILGRGTADQPVTYLPAGRARTLCGQALDWVEALPRP
jgi:hypothetical protein